MAGTYHHGDLRRALLDEAAAVLTEGGVASLSLRDLARRVGVSPTAPYHHFPNKAALVSAIVEDTLSALDRASEEAARIDADPPDRIRALGVAYVLFAVEHPERFRLTFRPEMGTPFATLDEGTDALPSDILVFRHLQRAVGDIGLSGRAQTHTALAAWALVHGLASLLVDGPLRPMASDLGRVRALAQEATAQLSL